MSDYRAAEEDETNTLHFMTPYSVAQAQSEHLQSEGYKMKDWEGQVCNDKGNCGPVESIVALFMMLAGAVVTELNSPQPFGPNNDLIKFLQQPLGGPNSELVKIREAILGHDQNGEIAKLIRDPMKRPVEIVQEVRDKIIPPSDNGDVARAIRDPVKCTAGKLFGECK